MNTITTLTVTQEPIIKIAKRGTRHLNTNKSLYERLCNKEARLALVGLGYVGLPIALEFANHFKVIGYDINENRVQMMKKGIDPSSELTKEDFENKDIHFTSASETLDKAEIIVVAVPTPVGKDKKPNLNPLTKACETIGISLGKGNIIIFESTVYPGCTEEVCIPILEKVSGLKYNRDFFIGYSPERINPGDKINTLTNIKKIVSGSNDQTKEEVYNLYNHIIKAGVHMAPSIKVAEAAKIVENTQRDVNIALMNELSTLFDVLNINTHDVLAAAGTKWNFLNFYPGLVGGHCIGVDPYYLIHKAKENQVNLNVISSSRTINDHMPRHVFNSVSKALHRKGTSINQSKVLILGSTFKENVTDIRNSKAAEMAQIFQENVKTLHVVDPHADVDEMIVHYQLRLTEKIEHDYDAIIYAVNHKEFEALDWEFIHEIRSNTAVIFDFKKLLGFPEKEENTVTYITL